MSVSTRHAGVMLPLWSAASTRSWGIGELPDLVPLGSWLASAGFDRLMILPINTIGAGETSPYSAISSMAIDPIYVAPDEVLDFERAGGVAAMSEQARAELSAVRGAAYVQYERVRRVKGEALALAFERFMRDEWGQLTTRAGEFAGYTSRERWWLDDYALYAAIAAETGRPVWLDWPAPLRDREPAAIDEARRSLGRELLRHQYLQWIAETQWRAARDEARRRGVTLLGDMPFMVTVGGPDVWVRPAEYFLDVSLGVPPDEFSATGQDWGLPTYRWERIARSGYSWIRQRARRLAALYDGFRVDHLVGLYRTYGRPRSGEPFFNPLGEAAQCEQGEAILRILIESGATIIAEDLGLVPDFVRESLARLNVPGCRVLRWERHWAEPGQPFIDTRAYPEVSAAMTGTHDTEPLAGWWAGADRDERRALLTLAGDTSGQLDPMMPWSDRLLDAILALMYRSASLEMILPIQDVFGWTDRINVPGTVGDANWTWRLPWRVDALPSVPEAMRRAETLRAFASRYARGATPLSRQAP